MLATDLGSQWFIAQSVVKLKAGAQQRLYAF
jgi:hypothetical protein